MFLRDAFTHFYARPTLLTLIQAAGWPIWLLIVTSVIGLALILERALSLRHRLVFPPKLPGQVLEMIRQSHDSSDAVMRLAGTSPLGRILAEVIINRYEDDATRLAAIESVGKDVAHALNRYLPALATIAVVAPLMGLFGTVVGMIEIFASYTPQGGDPAQLARGISVALYNTGFGILIAIPALIAHRYYRSKVDTFLHNMEREAVALDRIVRRTALPPAV